MQQRSLFLLVVVLAAAALTVLFYKGRQPEPVKVLIARRDLVQDVYITPEDVTWKMYSPSSVESDWITHSPGVEKQIVGYKVRMNTQKGQVVLRDSIQKVPGGVVAKLLPPGKMAYMLPLSRKAALSHLVDRGDHVDVLLTYSKGGKNKNEQAKNLVTSTVLRSIEVLAVMPPYGKVVETKDLKKKQQAGLPQTMIIILTPKQVKMLNLMSKRGSISYALLSAQTGKRVYVSSDDKHYELSELPLLPHHPDQKKVHSGPPTVTVVRGLSKTKHELEKARHEETH